MPLIFLGSEITADDDCSHEIKRCLLLERKAMTNLDSILRSRDITLLTKVSEVKAMVFPVITYGCKSWTIKKAEPRELTLLNCGPGEDSWESQPVSPKGNQPQIFIGKTDAEAKAPILWPRDVKSWLIGKDPNTGKNWEQEEKGVAEDEMVGWHH